MPWRPVLVISEFPLNFSPFVRFSVCVCAAGSDRRVVDFYCFPESHISLGARARRTRTKSLSRGAQKAKTQNLLYSLHSRECILVSSARTFLGEKTHKIFNFMRRRFVLRARCGDADVTFHDQDDYKNVECADD